MKSRDIERIQVDFIEQLVRSVVDTTISKVILKPRQEDTPEEWKNAIDLVLKNNDIEKLLKYDVRQKSKFGKSYVGFDVFEQEPIIWVANHNERNEALRINGLQQYAVRVVREYSAIPNATPVLRNEITYTAKDKTYLFLGGFGTNINTKNPSVEISKEFYNNTSSASFPWGYVSIETPKYIVEQNKFGKVPHNLGVIPAMEMLNKDISDYGIDRYLSDWYPAKDYIPLISEYIKYIAWEMELDHTRVIGMFSMQDLENITKTASEIAKSSNPQQALQQALKNYISKEIDEGIQGLTGEDKAIKKKLIIRTIGSEGNSVSVMNSKFDGAKHFQGLQNLISLVYKICGYSWHVAEGGGGAYENVSQTQQSQRSVFETTKEKVELFTRQWRELFIKIFYVIFNKTKELVDIEKDFDKYVHFEIVSNILMNSNSDWRKYLELKNSGLISEQRAIELIWPDMTDKQVKEELERLEEAKEKEEQAKDTDQYGAFNNQKPFGSSEYNKEETSGEDKEE